MDLIESRVKPLLVLSFAGLGVALLAALEGHVTWLEALCGFFGEGCRETARFSLMGISVWLWGMGFYAALAGAVLFFRRAVVWLVMIGLGAEISFAWIIFSKHLICVFCLLNALVVLLLVLLSLRMNRIWQILAIGSMVFVLSNALLSADHPSSPRDKREVSGDTVVAQVGDETISELDLESPLATRIYQLQQEIYRLKQDYLEKLIDKILLEKAARQEGVSVEQLLGTLLAGKVSVSDAEVDAYYKQNSSRWTQWNGTRTELENRIRLFLRQQKSRRIIEARIEPLRGQYPVAIHLREPPLPFSKVSVGTSPVWGPSDAAVTVVEFSDYLCPACRRAHEITKSIRETYTGKIRWVFKDYPLDIHKGSKKLAAAAHCAEEQGQFWKFQDLLFASHDTPDSAALKDYAARLGLDGQRFMQCVESGKYAARVAGDIDAAREAGVSSTPTFIINGRLKPGGLSLDDFKQMIDKDLAQAAVAHSGG